MLFQFANVLVFFGFALLLCGLMLGLGSLLRLGLPLLLVNHHGFGVRLGRSAGGWRRGSVSAGDA